MIRTTCFMAFAIFSTAACAEPQASILPASLGNAQAVSLPSVPEGVQAISLLGEELRSPRSDEFVLKNLTMARAQFESDPNDADNSIWLGRRTGYTGDFRGAIRVFSEGMAKHPDDARFYRHRGHRFISIRQFDRAITDLEHAATLIAGTEDIVEPDGEPNAAGVNVSTLHSNIWYHLGLAYYLNGDLENALRVYEIAVAQTPNDDMRVATTHWYYMTLRLLGRDDDARAALEPIREDMVIFENMPYHQLCLLYKGESETGTVLTSNVTGAGGDSAKYGIANWHYYNGRLDDAKAGFEEIIKTSAWASFGRIAAESDLARNYE